MKGIAWRNPRLTVTVETLTPAAEIVPLQELKPVNIATLTWTNWLATTVTGLAGAPIKAVAG